MTHKAKTRNKGANHDLPSAPGGVADANEFKREIELRAYHLYCERGCAPGNDVDDWIAAEQEVLGAHGCLPPKVGD